jgi:hypothetical protein
LGVFDNEEEFDFNEGEEWKGDDIEQSPPPGKDFKSMSFEERDEYSRHVYGELIEEMEPTEIETSCAIDEDGIPLEVWKVHRSKEPKLLKMFFFPDIDRNPKKTSIMFNGFAVTIDFI